MLEEVMGRAVRPALWRTADILGAEEAWLAALLEKEGPLPPILPVAMLSDQPVAKQRRTLRAWLAQQNVAGVGYDEVERVRALLDASPGRPAKVNLCHDRHARRRGGKLFLE